MRILLLIISLLTACGAAPTDDHVGTIDQSQTVTHDRELCPTGTPPPPAHHLVDPAGDRGTCITPRGTTVPRRCAQCTALGPTGSCMWTCWSPSNKCSIQNSNTACLGPDPGDYAIPANCDSDVGDS